MNPVLIAKDQERERHDAVLQKIRSLHDRLALSPRDSFLNYAIATLARKEGIDLKDEGIDFPLVPIVTDDPARRVDLFRLSTGMLALHESLQLTELVGPDRGRSSDSKILIRELEPPELPSLPFERLLKTADPKAGKPLADEEALFIPADWLYLRFATGADLLAFLKEADLWVQHGLQYYGRESRDRTMLWKTIQRLGLPDPREFPALYEAMPGPIMVTLSDIFLREGTDVTVVLPRGVPPALFGLDLTRPGIEVSRYNGELDGRGVISTSKRALDRLVGRAGDSLAESSDYRYMRTLLPADKNEAVFVYLSEAFLRRLVGPRLRILESRRVRCASHLRTLVNAALLYAMEEGQPAAGLQDLMKKEYLDKPLTCPHGGAYSLSRGFETACTVHHCLGDLTPNIELDLEEVNEPEASAYRRFARAYSNFWRRYFDPVGITMARDGSSWKMEMIVLPLADNSLYRNLSSLMGGAPLKSKGTLVTPSTIFHLTSKIDRSFMKDLDWRIFRSDLVPWESLRKDFLDGFQNTATLGLLDDRLLFDFDISGFVGEAVRWNRVEDMALVPLLGAANLPAYGVLPIANRERAESFLETLRKSILLQGRRPEGGQSALKHEAYHLAGKDIKALTLEIFSFKFRIFYFLREDALLVATRPDVLIQVMENARMRPEEEPYHAKLTLSPESWKEIKPDMLLSYEEKARKVCMHMLAELQPLAELELERPDRILGAELICPDHGRFEVNTAGHLECSIHGTSASPMQPAAPARKNSTARLLDGLQEVAFTLRFIEEGIHFTLRIDR